MAASDGAVPICLSGGEDAVEGQWSTESLLWAPLYNKSMVSLS